MSRIALACAGFARAAGVVLDEQALVQSQVHAHKPSMEDPYLEKQLNEEGQHLADTEHAMQQESEQMEVMQREMARGVNEMAERRLSQAGREMFHSRLAEEQDAEHRRDARLAELEQEAEKIKELRRLAQEQLESEKRDIAARARMRAALKTHQDEKARVEKEAENRRKEALANVSPQQVVGRLTLDEINAIPAALSAAVHNPLFMGTMKASSDFLKESATNYTLAAKAQLETFASENTDVSSSGFFPALARVFDGTWELLLAHQTDTLDAVSRIEKVVPEKLQVTLTPLLRNLALTITPLDTNTTALASMTAKSYSCSEIAKIMGDYAKKLNMARSAQNTTTMMAPVMATLLERKLAPNTKATAMSSEYYGSKEVTNLFQDTLRLGYVEMIGLESFSSSIIEKLGPVISDKLHCTWSSGRSLTLSMFVGVLSMAAGWLTL